MVLIALSVLYQKSSSWTVATLHFNMWFQANGWNRCKKQSRFRMSIVHWTIQLLSKDFCCGNLSTRPRDGQKLRHMNKTPQMLPWSTRRRVPLPQQVSSPWGSAFERIIMLILVVKNANAFYFIDSLWPASFRCSDTLSNQTSAPAPSWGYSPTSQPTPQAPNPTPPNSFHPQVPGSWPSPTAPHWWSPRWLPAECPWRNPSVSWPAWWSTPGPTMRSSRCWTRRPKLRPMGGRGGYGWTTGQRWWFYIGCVWKCGDYVQMAILIRKMMIIHVNIGDTMIF